MIISAHDELLSQRASIYIKPISDLKSSPVILCPEELIEFKKISSLKRRQEYLAGRFFLKQKATELVGLKLPFNEIIVFKSKNYKPFFRNPLLKSLLFSLSHSNKFIATAFSHFHNIGIDTEEVERFSKKPLELKPKWLHKDEYEKISKQRNTAHYLAKVWTQKEALYKCLTDQKNFVASEINLVSYLKKNSFALEYKDKKFHFYCFKKQHSLFSLCLSRLD